LSEGNSVGFACSDNFRSKNMEFAVATVTKAMSGSISGSVDLTPAEAEALRKGMIYVQIHSEGAPDGNLRGWLLK